MQPTRTVSATRKRAAGGFLFGLFTGVAIGLAVSLMIAFYLNRTPIPFVTAKKPAEKDAGAKPPAIAGLPQNAAAPGAAPEKPKFDFYKILPGAEPVTERELRERMRASKAGQQMRQGCLFHPGGLVPEPGRRRQPEGAARDPGIRVERRASEPA
jgi:hypothetical protein